MSTIQPAKLTETSSESLPAAVAAADKPVKCNKMGLWGAVSFVCGNVIGSGLFITPTAILKYTSSVGLSLSVWLASALISALGAYCYVELGTSIRKSGADFAYLCHVGWFPAAFAFMSTGCLMMYPSIVAVQAQTFSEYIFQGLRISIENKTLEHLAKVGASFILVAFLCFLNFFSIRKFVARFQICAALAKILATMSIVIVGFYFLIIKGKTENLQDPFKGSVFQPGLLAMAFFQGLYSYDGWDVLNFGIEEVKSPRRTLPLAILIGMTITAVIYFVTNLSYFVVLSVDDVLKSQAVAQTFAQQTMGQFQYAMPFLTSLMLIGSLNGTIFTASRYLFAAARQGHMPLFMSVVNRHHGSPRAAIFYHVIVAFCFALLGDLETLVNCLGFAQWLQRCLTMAVLLYIRFADRPVHADRIRTPILLPLVFFWICVCLVGATLWNDLRTAAVGLGFLGVAFVFYLVFLWDKSLMRFERYRDCCRNLNEKLAAINETIFNGEVEFNEETVFCTFEAPADEPDAHPTASASSKESSVLSDCEGGKTENLDYGTIKQ